jgi:hypothetical protein
MSSRPAHAPASRSRLAAQNRSRSASFTVGTIRAT